MPPSAREPLTDSPWYWVCLFAAMGLAAALAIAPKFGHRQARLLNRYQMKQQVLERSTDEPPPDVSPELYTPRSAMRTLAPLVVVLVLVFAGSGFMLIRGGRRAKSQATGREAKPDAPPGAGTPR